MENRISGLYVHGSDDLIFDWNTLVSAENSRIKACDRELIYVDPTLEGDLYIPDGINKLCDCCLKDCDKIYDIWLPKSFDGYINYQAFAPAKRSKRILFHPENDNYVTIDNCVIEKKSHTLVAFFNGGKIPCDDIVNSIGERAFEYAYLSEIVIPAQISKISGRAFGFNSLLRNIHFADADSQWYTRTIQYSYYTDDYDYTRPSMMLCRSETNLYHPISVKDPRENAKLFSQLSVLSTDVVKGKI